MRIHPSKEVEKALIRLNDALSTYERATSRESVLILREVDGFVHRSVSGKPCYLDDVPDYQLMLNIIGHNQSLELTEEGRATLDKPE